MIAFEFSAKLPVLDASLVPLGPGLYELQSSCSGRDF